MSRIENQLQSSAIEFASSARSSQEALSKAISEVVRSTLISEIQRFSHTLSHDIVQSFSNSLSINVNHDVNLNRGWADNLTSTLQEQILNLLVSSSKSSGVNRETQPKIGMLSLISRLAILIPNPLVKIVLAILPSVVGSLFESFNENKERAKILEAINNQIIPSVLRQIRPEVASILVKISESLVQTVAQQFEVKINEQKSILEKSQKDHEQTTLDIVKNTDLLEQIIKNIDAVSEKVIFKG